MGDTRTLYLLRHAQAHPGGPSDHQRRLDSQGEADATALGTVLRDRALPPFRVLCSDAARTRGTWHCLETAGLAAAAVSFDEALYHGGEDVYRKAWQDRSGADLMIVGHNPVIAAAAGRLAQSGSPAALRELTRGFPTCSLAILRFDDPEKLSAGFLIELLVPPHRRR